MDAVLQIHFINNFAQFFFANEGIDFKGEHFIQARTGFAPDILWNDLIEEDETQGAIDDFGSGHAFEGAFDTHFDGRLQGKLCRLIRHHGFVRTGEDTPCTQTVITVDGEVVATNNHILRRRHHRFTILRFEDVVVCEHEEARFRLCFHGQWNVHSHLIAVKVGVVCGTYEGVKFECFTFDKHGFKRLNTEAVKRRCAVQKNRMFFDDTFEDVPHFGARTFHHAFGVFAMVSFLELHKTFDDEGLEEFECHFLWQTALIELEFWANDDNRTTRVVNTFAKQVLTETTLLTAKEIRERLERTVARTRHRTTATAVINEGIDRFLKHALFVANDDIRRTELKQTFEAVVTVDHATIQIIQVTCCKATAIKLHHGAKVWWDDGNNVHDHPFGAIVGGAEGFHHFQTFHRTGTFLTFGFAIAFLFDQFSNIFFELLADGIQIHLGEDFFERFCTHSCTEATTTAIALHLAIFRIGDEFMQFEPCFGCIAGIEHDEIGEIQHLFKRSWADIKEHAHTARNALEIPDMTHRCGQLDVTHALTAHFGTGHLHTTFVTNFVLVFEFDTFIFTAVTFPVLLRSKNALTEKAITFRLQCAVVDGFGFGHFAKAPFKNLLRRCHADTNSIQIG